LENQAASLFYSQEAVTASVMNWTLYSQQKKPKLQLQLNLMELLQNLEDLGEHKIRYGNKESDIRRQ